MSREKVTKVVSFIDSGMCAYVCVCVRACMRVCMHVCVYTCRPGPASHSQWPQLNGSAHNSTRAWGGGGRDPRGSQEGWVCMSI